MIVALLLTQKTTYKDDFLTLVGYGVSLLSSTVMWYFLNQPYMACYHRIHQALLSLQTNVIPTTRNDASGSISSKDKEKATLLHHLAWLTQHRQLVLIRHRRQW